MQAVLIQTCKFYNAHKKSKWKIQLAFVLIIYGNFFRVLNFQALCVSDNNKGKYR